MLAGQQPDGQGLISATEQTVLSPPPLCLHSPRLAICEMKELGAEGGAHPRRSHACE